MTASSEAALNALAEDIHADIARMEHAKTDWAESVLALCEHVAEARVALKADQAFGAWWDAQDFGLNKDERAALVKLGADIEAARNCLAATESQSIRLIARDEFPRFRNAAKPTGGEEKPKAKPKTKAAAPGQDNPKTQPTKPPAAAKSDSPAQPDPGPPEAPERKLARGQCPETATVLVYRALHGGPMPANSAEIVKEFGIAETAAQEVLRMVRWAVPLIEEITASPVGLSKSATEKYAALERKLHRTMEAMFQMRVEEAATAKASATREEMFKALTKDVEDRLRFADLYRPERHIQRFPFTKAEYNSIMFCLHPDQRESRTREQLDAACQLFQERQPKLALPDRFVDKAPPRVTYEEFIESLKTKGKKAKKENAA